LENHDHAAFCAHMEEQNKPKPKRQRLSQRTKDSIMRDMGLTKVRGTVSGKIYYSKRYIGNGRLSHRSRMLTDDRELCYEGRSDDNSSFEPLDCFGRPNFGCTIIQYWQAGKDGGWVDL